LLTAFADISLAQLGLVAAMALLASVVGGVSGYGTGALMPLVLVPIVGAEPVVPIIAISSLLTNTSRAAAFFALIDARRVLIVLPARSRPASSAPGVTPGSTIWGPCWSSAA
jgi:hypothetical protein